VGGHPREGRISHGIGQLIPYVNAEGVQMVVSDEVRFQFTILVSNVYFQTQPKIDR
jgi:hypothetical protein